MNKIILLEFLRNSISMKIESHQTEPEKKKISTKNVAWYWRVPYFTGIKIKVPQSGILCPLEISFLDTIMFFNVGWEYPP